MTNFTPQQLSVISHIATSTKSLCVIARAGSGKTTTLIEGIAQLPPTKSLLVVAFSKSVQLELESKIKHPNATVRTMNSLGWSILRREYRNALLKADKTSAIIEKYLRKTGLEGDELYEQKRILDDAITTLKYSLIRPEYVDMETCIETLSLDDAVDIVSDRLATALYTCFHQDFAEARAGTFNFDDQIYYPLIADFNFPQYETIVVDEAQDLNPAQQEVLLRCRTIGTKIIFVGDPAQSIYGFRGAMPESMETLRRELDADTLYLSTSFRCARDIITYAKQIVPDIEPCAGAGQGKIGYFKTIPLQLIAQTANKASVLCRNNAPLYGLALQLIRSGTQCYIKGKSLKPYLNGLLKQLSKGKAKSYGWDRTEFNSALNTYFENEKANTPPSRAKRLASLEDKIEVLRFIAEEVSYGNIPFTSKIILDKVDALTIQGNGIPLSTGHQAKGLEWDVVWFLNPELIPSQYATKDEDFVQEENLKYVIITRARFELNLITNSNKEKKNESSI